MPSIAGKWLTLWYIFIELSLESSTLKSCQNKSINLFVNGRSTTLSFLLYMSSIVEGSSILWIFNYTLVFFLFSSIIFQSKSAAHSFKTLYFVCVRSTLTFPDEIYKILGTEPFTDIADDATVELYLLLRFLPANFKGLILTSFIGCRGSSVLNPFVKIYRISGLSRGGFTTSSRSWFILKEVLSLGTRYSSSLADRVTD